MHLREQLSNWDGKSTSYLSDIYDGKNSVEILISQVFELLENAELQTAGTWLLKHALESGASFEQHQVYEFYDRVDQLVTWQAKLHSLQMMQLLNVPEELKYKLANFCRLACEDENKFVRAWGYNGLYELANLYPEFREGFDIVVASAMETEPASVKARLRNVIRNINANWH